MTVIDHDAIRAARDRSATGALVRGLIDADPDERARIVRTLLELGDPAAEAPLVALVEDRALSDEVRFAACDLLGDGWCPDPARTRRWWSEGDETQRAGALEHMGRGEADLLLPILGDPSHPLHRHAVSATTFGFDAAQYVAARVAALDHPDPLTRATAARAVFFDEPAAAEPGLIRAVSAPEEEVALSALDTLRYYPTVAVIRAVAAARDGDPRPTVRDAALETLADLAHEIAIVASTAAPGGRDAVLAWLAPVREALPLDDEDLAPIDRGPMPPRPPRPTPDPTAGADDPDPAVRERAAVRLVAEGDHDGVLRLLSDPSAWVRKMTAYHARELAPDERVARRLRELLADPENTGTQGSELVESWVVHAAPADRAPTLHALATTDDRESVRTAAIRGLEQLGPEHVVTLWSILEEPVGVTWAPQLAVLDVALRHGLRPPERPLAALTTVDHLQVVAATGALR
ncbi:MAG: hypothetical protein H6738_08905 [Alphaproteobacteria bacterium]|nr:hypothetical protein [Alphaproteobacteria bacterium]MCB9696880.1 hypothetical protein [Alphaproteobacteria bacterium]